MLQVWLLDGHLGSIGVFCSECRRGGLGGGHIVDDDSNGKALVVLEHGHGTRNFEGVDAEGAKKDPAAVCLIDIEVRESYGSEALQGRRGLFRDMASAMFCIFSMAAV